MGPVLYVMAILGCGETDAACQPVSLAPARYESLEACNAASEDGIASAPAADFPVLVAQCRRADAQTSLTVNAADVDLPEPAIDRPRIQRASFKAAPARS